MFLLDDDKRRHRWFTTRFKGDFIDIASNVSEAQQLLSAVPDAIFSITIHPEHYHAESTDDERPVTPIAAWLSSNPELQRASTILVHTRNADGAMRMVGELAAPDAADYVPFPLLAERIKSYWQR